MHNMHMVRSMDVHTMHLLARLINYCCSTVHDVTIKNTLHPQSLAFVTVYHGSSIIFSASCDDHTNTPTQQILRDNTQYIRV
jgi:hypothetical protein